MRPSQPTHRIAARAGAIASCLLLASCGPTATGRGLGLGGDAGEPLDASAASIDLSGADLLTAAPLDYAFVGPDLQRCPPDGDGDMIALCDGDCDDENPAVHPGAPDLCDGADNNCDGRIDEAYDQDKDGWTTCAGDCDDGNATIHPAALPRCDGKDNNCNGKPDTQEDIDGDGYAACNDCDDTQQAVSPGAVEVPGDMIDNDCDGMKDEPPPVCDMNLPFNSADPKDYARAIELCPDTFLVDAQFPSLADNRARAIAGAFGLYQPKAGRNFMVVSSGMAAAVGQPNYRAPQDGTDFGRSAGNPVVGCKNCGSVSNRVYDLTEFRLTLKVPTNAKSFSFDFNFLSSEYPEWVGSEFNDKFLVVLTSKGFTGNISFDAKGRPIEINNAFFTVIRAQDLAGTGYDAFDLDVLGPAGGGTGWLTTTAPVTPGELITLRFIILDEGDNILDSAAIVDRFRWSLQPAMGGPSTERTM